MTLNTEFKRSEEREPLIERKPMSKWKASQIKSKWTDVRQENLNLSEAFKLLLTRIKRLYSGLNIEAYEQSYRGKTTINSTTVHVFLTQDLYLELEVEPVHHQCRLLFDCNNCHHESQIREWLKKYPFSINTILSPREGGTKAYFNRVKVFLGSKHFFIL